MVQYVNKFGRKGGRGLRPWLLIPKVLGVATYFGGTVAATSLAFVTQPTTIEEHQALARVIGSIFLFAAVPGLIVAIVCGAGLLIHHGRPFLRLRWLQVKLGVLLVTIPALHLWMSSHVKHLGAFDAAADGPLPEATLTAIRGGLIVATVTAAMVIVLGRHKPRLGQRPVVKGKVEEATA